MSNCAASGHPFPCDAHAGASFSDIVTLIEAADGGPGVDADRGRKFLQTEPRAGLIGAHLKSHALAKNIDGQLEILQRGRAERERLLRLRGAGGISETGQRQVPCPFDEHGEIAE